MLSRCDSSHPAVSGSSLSPVPPIACRPPASPWLASDGFPGLAWVQSTAADHLPGVRGCLLGGSAAQTSACADPPPDQKAFCETPPHAEASQTEASQNPDTQNPGPNPSLRLTHTATHHCSDAVTRCCSHTGPSSCACAAGFGSKDAIVPSPGPARC